MADFLRALPYVLKNEGGWSDDPNDPGGATNYGITLAEAQKHGIADKEALKNISPEKVAEIYHTDYWQFDGVNDQRVATKVFDIHVNMGDSIRVIQNALNRLGACLAIDGIYGKATESALNAFDPDHILDMLCRVAAEKYQSIVYHRPASSVFLKGWLIRAAKVPSGA